MIRMTLMLIPMAMARMRESPWSSVEGPLGLTLVAAPPVIQDGGEVIISWKNLDQEHPNDYVTLTCGPTADKNDFLQLRNVSSHFVQFDDLYMLRCPYEAHYYRYGKDGESQLLGSISIPMVDSFNTPKQGHLGFTDAIDEMVIMYNSASTQTPQVKFGTTSHNLNNIRSGKSTTYKASDMCHEPATTIGQKFFRSPGYFHSVVMDGLVPLSEYFYQYGNDLDGWSAIRSFISRPALGDNTTISFIAYADMGVDDSPRGWSTSLRVFEDVVNKDYNSFLLHFGDISYARGVGYMWDKYFALIEPVATRIPYLVSIGNHEFDYISGGEHDPSHLESFHPSWGNYGADSSGECGVPMVHRFHAPSNGRGLFWYSFEYGLATVIQMSSEHNFLPGSLQHSWLQATLAGIDRTRTPWIILTAHRMMYTTQMGEEEDLRVSLHFRAAVEPLLQQYKVNLVLTGHQHSYERSCPVYQGKCVENGTVHMVVGSAGAELEQQGFSDQIGEWSVSHINAFGYLRGHISRTKMHLEFVLNTNGNVYDQVELRPWQ
ncbi:calcineurin-like phosphoesterase [Thraustotheca clavata]|uniref:Purple acid phosphatase n=1 Tax=Thraustotheca clavata TaxID=74557 RepID=A0A1W0A2W5_9STRA|nr:calcineurin-like phosphoesterase [Thraustotheca clavata]